MESRRQSGMSSASRMSHQSLTSRLSRKKSTENILSTNLRRCLSTFDVTLLALGHMVGSGVYVLTATVAKNIAGPSIVLAFVFSGFASFLAALSYAELGVRYPRCGSAYSYAYLALGELWAFLVGWNMALENIIGAASNARACSAYVDSLANGVIKNVTDDLIGRVDVEFLTKRLDFLALLIMMVFVIYLSFGIRMTTYLTNAFTIVNVAIIAIFIGVGAYFSDAANWTNEETGGFMPYGWQGVLAASASCFYAYVGFDVIATAGEETRDPQKSIPRAMFISMSVATLAYVGVSSVLTLMVNYRDITEDSGLPEAMSAHGADWAKFVITVGAICGMCTGIIGCLFALTRIVYVMADDGLLFTFCSTVSPQTKTPLRAMYVFASIAAFLAFMLDIDTLVELFSIGTLFAYLVVSASVIVLRYRPEMPGPLQASVCELPTISETSAKTEHISVELNDSAGQLRQCFRWLEKRVKMRPGRLVSRCVLCFALDSFVLCGFVKSCFRSIMAGSWWAVLVVAVLLLGLLLSFIVILMHKQSTAVLRYKVPLVPLLPAVSIFINAVLMVNLQAATWIRLLLWVCVGLCLYFSYGVEHSKLSVVLADEPGAPIGVSSADAPPIRRAFISTPSREYLFSASIPSIPR